MRIRRIEGGSPLGLIEAAVEALLERHVQGALMLSDRLAEGREASLLRFDRLRVEILDGHGSADYLLDRPGGFGHLAAVGSLARARIARRLSIGPSRCRRGRPGSASSRIRSRRSGDLSSTGASRATSTLRPVTPSGASGSGRPPSIDRRTSQRGCRRPRSRRRRPGPSSRREPPSERGARCEKRGAAWREAASAPPNTPARRLEPYSSRTESPAMDRTLRRRTAKSALVGAQLRRQLLQRPTWPNIALCVRYTHELWYVRLATSITGRLSRHP